MNGSPDVQRVRRITVVGLVLNVLLTLSKLIVGAVCASQALIADGVHSFSDLATDFAVIIGVRYWSAPPDEEHPYGHGKIETMITAFIAVLLGLVGFSIGANALVSWRETGETVGKGALAIALFSIVSKEILFRVTKRTAREVHSPALEANAWHHRSDAISSIPVAVAVTVACFRPDWYWVDKLGALIVSAFILYSAWEILRPTLGILADRTAKDLCGKVVKCGLAVEGVKAIHRVRVRSCGQLWLVDLHVLVDGELTVSVGHDISTQVQDRLLASGLGIVDAVAHLEPYTQGSCSNPAPAK